MGAYHKYTSKTYLASHYSRERHTLTIKSKETKYPAFVFEDENGIEYYHAPDFLPIETEHGFVRKPITMFGKWAESNAIGESVCASFYIKSTTKGNEIFDVRMSKGKIK